MSGLFVPTRLAIRNVDFYLAFSWLLSNWNGYFSGSSWFQILNLSS